MLQAENKTATVSEISRVMHVKIPSAVYALRKFSKQNLVEYNKRSPIKLTRRGERLGADVFHRHEALRHFLVEILGIDSNVATKDACKMEYFLSPARLERLAGLKEFVANCQRGEAE